MSYRRGLGRSGQMRTVFICTTIHECFRSLRKFGLLQCVRLPFSNSPFGYWLLAIGYPQFPACVSATLRLCVKIRTHSCPFVVKFLLLLAGFWLASSRSLAAETPFEQACAKLASRSGKDAE